MGRQNKTERRLKPVGGKKLLVQIPTEMRSELEHIAKEELRTLNDLVREACRRYIVDFRRVAPVRTRLEMLYECDEVAESVAKD